MYHLTLQNGSRVLLKITLFQPDDESALEIDQTRRILSGASRPRTFARGVSPDGYHVGSQNLINRYFEYHIRDQRGGFTPGGSLLKKFL